MSDTAKVFGTTYTGVTALKVSDGNSGTLTYIRPQGTKSVTANGNAQDVKTYEKVDVNVPNSYSASDEGKVVSNGALVSQSSQTVTENGTYDTTTKNEVVVDVQSGGGGGATVMASGTVTLASNGTITIPHNLNSLRVVCLVSPTVVMTPGKGYQHLGLVAANYQEIFSAELQNVTYDFSTYNSNFTGAITRTGAYPAGSALKSPWTNRTEAQWNQKDSWAANIGWCNSTGADLNVTFNLNDIKANSFSKGTYRWEAYVV